MTLNAHETRTAILKGWDRKLDTFAIAKFLQRHEYDVERQLHYALDLRRAVNRSLGLNHQKDAVGNRE